MALKFPVKNLKGEQVSEVELSEKIFGATVSHPLMHQAMLRQLANAHLGTHKAQTRAEVHRTTKKLFKQKGTGNARQGSRKAPHHRGGGVAFGPVVRSYHQDMPRKMRQAAIRSALTQKLADNELIIVDSLSTGAPKTKDFVAAIKALGVAKKGLVVLAGRDASVEKSAGNIEGVKTLHAGYLNIRDIFTHDHLVIPLDALDKINAWLG
jgi:large subunit ribosomal protein L4